MDRTCPYRNGIKKSLKHKTFLWIKECSGGGTDLEEDGDATFLLCVFVFGCGHHDVESNSKLKTMQDHGR
jgi:hypothetical protein